MSRMWSVKKHFGELTWDEYYRRYQQRLAQEYLIPVLRSWKVELEGKKLLEVGSGDGGCGEAFFSEGCKVVALEIDERLVNISRDLNEKAGVSIKVFLGDVCDSECEVFREGPFDIVVLRDVLEHIEFPRKALENIRNSLSEGGCAFCVFPPYYSAYGAHQQILPKKYPAPLPLNRLPYIQLLPDRLFYFLVQGDKPSSKEVARLRRIKLTIRKFEALTEDAGFLIKERSFYLLRPTHKIRYGTPVLKASLLGKLPVLKELLVTGAYYLLGIGRG